MPLLLTIDDLRPNTLLLAHYLLWMHDDQGLAAVSALDVEASYPNSFYPDALIACFAELTRHGLVAPPPRADRPLDQLEREIKHTIDVRALRRLLDENASRSMLLLPRARPSAFVCLPT